MKLVAFDKYKIGWYKPGKNQAILIEFAESDMECAKLEGYSQKSAKIAQANLMACAKRLGLSDTICIKIRGDAVFLIKK